MIVANRRMTAAMLAPVRRGSDRDRQVAASLSRPRLAYLTNVYPKISHSFIRTEILALEQAGFSIDRFTIRRTPDVAADWEDHAEQERTTALLPPDRSRLAWAIVERLVRRPRGTVRALWKAIGSGCAHGLAPLGLIRALAYFAEAAALARQLDRTGVRHVHVHFGTNPVTVAQLAARMADITYSFTVHGPDEFDAPRALDLAGKIAEAAFVAGVSSYGRGQLMRWSDPTHWDRIHVVRCSIAHRFLDAPSPLEAPRRLVCVARLNAQKGLPLLIEAMGRLAMEPDFTLDIIGDGEQRAAIEAQIAQAGQGDRIRLLGWRAPQEVLHELAQARAFVLPSFAEGLPVVLMEALALGRPVIATAIAGIPELVDAENGWLVPSGSAEALAEAMREALRAPPARLCQMGAIGRARVHARHHPVVNGEALAELLAPLT
jgi:glycosyltransferase involved in cell wall biosynthesis